MVITDEFIEGLNSKLKQSFCIKKGIHEKDHDELYKDLREKGYTFCDRCGVKLELEYIDGNYQLKEIVR